MKHIIFISYFILSSILFINVPINLQASEPQELPREMTTEEAKNWPEYIKEVRAKSSRLRVLPNQNIHSLAEWEESEAVMIRWLNMSLVKALSENGNLKILASNSIDKSNWEDQLQANNIDSSKYSFYVTPLDSMWVRDYGPWWIMDGKGEFGIIDNIYNRPRPDDDAFPEFVANELHVPIYKTNLVHTGGNYYNDGLGNAFSSTLVMSENSNFSVQVVLDKMMNFLGINNYFTSPLGKSITIEHLDTFGKLVAPDTWVFSQFAEGSKFFKDSETMVQKLQTMKSPYGTPYKIFRLKMISIGGDNNFRAYINSFISNGALYFPSYGDNSDKEVQDIYQQALPGYKIIPVENKGTLWGDSVHCRTRNIMKQDTIFIFPKVEIGEEVTVAAEIFTPKNTTITNAEVVMVDNATLTKIPMHFEDGKYVASFPKLLNGKTKFYIKATNNEGLSRIHPRYSPIIL